ncbi:MAG: hypothetical protein HKP49_08280 [Maribacter sp.]|nr:hypothetical protein [Maribacter sp.]
MKNLYVILFVLTVFCGYSQGNLNDYKYIIVPKKFDAFREANQYKTSTLVKYLFDKNGFNVVYDDALPTDLNSERCLGLMVSIRDESSMFNTKASLVLKDCSSQEVLTTLVGKSKVKEFEEAYKEVITEAFGTIAAMNYKYVPKKKSSEPVTVSFKNDVKSLDNKNEPKNKVDAAVVEQVAKPEEQVYKSKEPVDSKIKKAEAPTTTAMIISDKNDSNILYAQEIPNGYQLVDSTPKIRFKLFKTSIPDVYTVAEDNGVVFKKDGKWYIEYYIGNTLKTQELNIKF